MHARIDQPEFEFIAGRSEPIGQLCSDVPELLTFRSNRLPALAAFIAGVCTLFGARAQAATEFCPATIAGQVSQSDATHVRLRLGSLSERTVTGFLRVQTDSGWFSAPFANVHLAAITHLYDTGGFSFSHSNFVSPDILVRFPNAVTLKYAYVSQAATQGEKIFGWDAKGAEPCKPTPLVDPKAAPSPSPPPPLAPDAVTLTAQTIDNPFPEKCDTPSAPIHMTKIGDFHMPAIFGYDNFSARPEGTTGVIIAVDDDGTVLDTWLWETSGTPMLDDAVIDEAKRSTFTPGRVFCRNVPGFYLLRTYFKP